MRHPLLACAIAALTLSACNSIAATPNSKKLLEYGWNSRTPLTLDVRQLEASVFDGVILKPASRNLTFSTQPLPDTEFQPSRATLQQKPSKKLGNSFLMVNVYTDDDWDWFNDAHWAAAERNVRNMVRTAKQGGLRGIVFDSEPYSKNPWLYATQPKKGTYSFKAYQSKVRERGAALMRVMQQEFPNITIINLFGFTMFEGLLGELEYEAKRNNRSVAEQLEPSLSEDWGGLWAAFLNGWFAAAEGNTRIVDGNEPAYYYLSGQAFTDSRKHIQTELLQLVDTNNRSAYAQHNQIGQAVYVDGVANLHQSPRFVGYYLENDTNRAKLLEHNTYHALRTADEFVWVYNENPNWWNNPPATLDAALRNAKTKLTSGQDLGLDMGFLTTGKANYDARVEFGGTITANGAGVRPTRFEPAEADAACTPWGDQGRYGCAFPKGWTGTVRPIIEGKTLEPAERTYQNLQQGRWDQDYRTK